MQNVSKIDFGRSRCRFAGLGVLATALFLLVAPAEAGTREAEAFVKERGADAIKVLSTRGLTEQRYVREFYDFVDKSFDVPAMAQFALGVHWRQATEQQRAEYVTLYKDYFVGTYAARFRTFSGENFEVTGARAINDTESLVQSRIIRPGNQAPITVEWHVREQNSPKVVDMTIEGLRLGVTLRDEFAGVIQSGGLDALFKALRERNAKFGIGA